METGSNYIRITNEKTEEIEIDLQDEVVFKEEVEVSEVLSKELKENFEANDWYEFSQEDLEMLNYGKPIPPPYPNSKDHYELEKCLEDAYSRGWLAIPLRLYYDEFEKKKTEFVRAVELEVTQLAHQIYNIRTFRHSSFSRKPATAIARINGPESNAITWDLDRIKGDSSHTPDAALKILREIGVIFNPKDVDYIRMGPGGGRHYDFKWEEEFKDCSTTSNGFFGKDSHIDLRGNKSLTFIGGWVQQGEYRKKYSILQAPKVLSRMPPRLKELILMRHKEFIDNEPINIAKANKSWEDLTEEQKTLLSNRLKENKKANYQVHDAFDIICKAVDIGVKKEVLLDKMQDSNILNYIDRPDSFEKAYKSAIGKVGCGTFDWKAFKAKIQEFKEASKADYIIDKYLNKLHNEDKELKFLIPGLMAEGSMGIWFSYPGKGKTLLSTLMAYNISQGENILGNLFSVPEPLKVLYMVGEIDSKEYINNYLKRLNVPINDPMLKFFFYLDMLSDKNIENSDLNLVDPAGQVLFEKMLKETQAKIVVLDSVMCFFGRVRGMVSEEEAIIKLLKYLKRVVSEFGIHILIVHHPRKKSTDSKGGYRKLELDDVIGSSLWTRMCNYTIGIDHVIDEDTQEPIPLMGQVSVLKSGSTITNFPEFIYKIENYTVKKEDKIINKVKLEIVKYIDKPDKDAPAVREAKIKEKYLDLKTAMISFGDEDNNYNITTKVLQDKVNVPTSYSLRTFVNYISKLKELNIIEASGESRVRSYRFTDDYIAEMTLKSEHKEVFNPEVSDVGSTGTNSN